MKKIIFFSIILFGFTAMAAQIVFMRELLIVFYGNELSIGLILSVWLIAGAIGSSLLGGISDKSKNKITLFSLCQIGLSLILPSTILAIRSIKTILHIVSGEIIPFFPVAIFSFIVLAPTCIILGFMFSLSCRLYQVESAEVRIAKVYMLEAVGAMAGGLMASFILVRLYNSVNITAMLSLLNIIAAVLLLMLCKENKFRIFLFGSTVIILLIVISMWLFNGWDELDKWSLKRQWQPEELITSKNSIYGNVVLTKRLDEFSFFDNGLHLYTIPDQQSAEEAVHFALLEHPAPRDVLLIGGGAGGLIEEILKQPIKKVDYVELDPIIITIAQDYLPAPYSAPLKDPRVSIENLDGRLFIKTTDKKYDCVIISLGDPHTAQLNRYYTVEFFRQVKRILKKGGIISFALSSSENYINQELKNFLRSVYLSLQEVFAQIKIIPGDTAYFLACDKLGILTYDYRLLIERAKERHLDLKYVREYYLFSKLSPQRLVYIERSVKKDDGVRINYDFRPISYYYNTIFWATHFKDSLFPKILRAATEARVLNSALIIYALIILFGYFKRFKRFLKTATLMAVMTTGFSEMAFQIVVLLSFQIIYGFLFYKLGLILTSFMIGLMLGSWWVIKIMPKIKDDLAAFIRTQLSICIYPLLLPIFFYLMANTKHSLVFWMGSNIFFPFLPIVAGFIGGFQFPLANKICLKENAKVGRIAGLSYGLDLLGSCLGALLTGAILIPVLGITKTCLLVAGMNFAVLVILLLFLRNSGIK